MTVNASGKNGDSGSTEIETSATLTDEEFRQKVVQMLDKLALDVMEGNVEAKEVNTGFVDNSITPPGESRNQEKILEVIYTE